MKKSHQVLIIIIFIVTTVGFIFIQEKNSKATTYIGLLKDDAYLFEDITKIKEALNGEVQIIYYENYEAMLPDILSGKLLIFERPLLDFLSNRQDAKAVAAIPADYILAGILRSDVSQIGVSEKNTASILIDSSTMLKDKKISILQVPENEILPLVREGTIDFAIFRNSVPEGLTEDIRLSSLSLESDVLVVKNNLLEKREALPDAIFQSFNPKHEELQKLPSREEIKNAVNYLFKIGSIKQRGQYEDYVHKD